MYRLDCKWAQLGTIQRPPDYESVDWANLVVSSLINSGQNGQIEQISYHSLSQLIRVYYICVN